MFRRLDSRLDGYTFSRRVSVDYRYFLNEKLFMKHRIVKVRDYTYLLVYMTW